MAQERLGCGEPGCADPVFAHHRHSLHAEVRVRKIEVDEHHTLLDAAGPTTRHRTSLPDDVIRLDVAMQNAVVVHMSDREQHIPDQVLHGARRDEPIAETPQQAVNQCAAISPLHDEVEKTIILQDLVERHDCRVPAEIEHAGQQLAIGLEVALAHVRLRPHLQHPLGRARIAGLRAHALDLAPADHHLAAIALLLQHRVPCEAVEDLLALLEHLDLQRRRSGRGCGPAGAHALGAYSDHRGLSCHRPRQPPCEEARRRQMLPVICAWRRQAGLLGAVRLARGCDGVASRGGRASCHQLRQGGRAGEACAAVGAHNVPPQRPLPPPRRPGVRRVFEDRAALPRATSAPHSRQPHRARGGWSLGVRGRLQAARSAGAT
mmetsp:Transcript_98711/g.284840  ORF Transcript_98711/g.284840 Transcript_98711/m.284840 type:complete len:377 (+) Transcript_98711:524-1654(+)